MLKRLANKTALITGGGSWIGKEIASVYAREGAQVFILGRDEKKLEQTVIEIKNTGGTAAYCSADVSDANSLQDAFAKLLSTYGQLDILVQNAAVFPSALIADMDIAEWKKVIDINLTGSFLMLQTALASLKKSAAGRVIFISSIAGEEIGYPGLSGYTASKAGMNGFMRTAALELAASGITVNSIDPGNILNTDIHKTTKAHMDDMLRSIPLGRLGHATDVANLALFLASEESGFITGQHIVIDGGETIA